ncbi:MAG: hypothetical protein AAGF49_08860 [Pseudomonadota bacterium]
MLTWPQAIGVTQVSWLSGPAARTSGRNTASDGSEQTFDAPGAPIAFALDLSAKKGRAARIERGIVTALQSGYNACRIRLIDPHRRAPEIPATTWQGGTGRWSNGAGWGATNRTVPLKFNRSAGRADLEIRSQAWADDLDYGDWIGITPHHFGAYMIVGKTPAGVLHIWPRLRATVTTDQAVTLSPVLVMRSFPGGSNLQTGIVTGGQRIALVEVPDPQARQCFTRF